MHLLPSIFLNLANLLGVHAHKYDHEINSSVITFSCLILVLKLQIRTIES